MVDPMAALTMEVCPALVVAEACGRKIYEVAHALKRCLWSKTSVMMIV